MKIEVKNHLGIGARLVWCLELLMYCNEKNIKAVFKFSYEDSNPEDDFFSSFFKNGKSNGFFIPIYTIGELGLTKNYNKELSLELAQKLVKENIEPLESIQEEVNDFFEKELNSEKILGIHFRNTDKKLEAKAVEFDTVLSNIDYCLQKFPTLTRIFLTTDDQNFIDFLEKTHLSHRLVYRKDTFRSTDDTPIHEQKKLNKYDMNKDAVVNMFILAKCTFIIKTSSALSAFSLLYNPAIPFIILNKPHEEKLWFPESELLKHMSFEPNSRKINME